MTQNVERTQKTSTNGVVHEVRSENGGYVKHDATKAKFCKTDPVKKLSFETNAIWLPCPPCLVECRVSKSCHTAKESTLMWHHGRYRLDLAAYK